MFIHHFSIWKLNFWISSCWPQIWKNSDIWSFNLFQINFTKRKGECSCMQNDFSICILGVNVKMWFEKERVLDNVHE